MSKKKLTALEVQIIEELAPHYETFLEEVNKIASRGEREESAVRSALLRAFGASNLDNYIEYVEES